MDKEQLTKILALIRSEQAREKKANELMNTLCPDTHTLCTLGQDSLIKMLKIVDFLMYELFCYYLYERMKEWHIEIDGKHYTWDTDEGFIDFLIQFKK